MNTYNIVRYWTLPEINDAKMRIRNFYMNMNTSNVTWDENSSIDEIGFPPDWASLEHSDNNVDYVGPSSIHGRIMSESQFSSLEDFLIDCFNARIHHTGYPSIVEPNDHYARYLSLLDNIETFYMTSNFNEQNAQDRFDRGHHFLPTGWTWNPRTHSPRIRNDRIYRLLTIPEREDLSERIVTYSTHTHEEIRGVGHGKRRRNISIRRKTNKKRRHHRKTKKSRRH